jgi:hypothetical protein
MASMQKQTGHFLLTAKVSSAAFLNTAGTAGMQVSY